MQGQKSPNFIEDPRTTCFVESLESPKPPYFLSMEGVCSMYDDLMGHAKAELLFH
jgi:hypothetical protein